MSPQTWRGIELGAAQAHSTVGPVAVVVCATFGLWLLAVIYAVGSVLGLLLWRRLGWTWRP